MITKEYAENLRLGEKIYYVTKFWNSYQVDEHRIFGISRVLSPSCTSKSDIRITHSEEGDDSTTTSDIDQLYPTKLDAMYGVLDDIREKLGRFQKMEAEFLEAIDKENERVKEEMELLKPLMDESE